MGNNGQDHVLSWCVGTVLRDRGGRLAPDCTGAIHTTFRGRQFDPDTLVSIHHISLAQIKRVHRRIRVMEERRKG